MLFQERPPHYDDDPSDCMVTGMHLQSRNLKNQSLFPGHVHMKLQQIDIFRPVFAFEEVPNAGHPLPDEIIHLQRSPFLSV